MVLALAVCCVLATQFSSAAAVALRSRNAVTKENIDDADWVNPTAVPNWSRVHAGRGYDTSTIDKMIDDNSATSWNAHPDRLSTFWAVFDLGASKTCTGMRFRSMQTSGHNPAKVTVEQCEASDGSRCTVLKTCTRSRTVGYQVCAFDSSSTGRYFKVSVPGWGPHGNWQSYWSDVQFQEEASPPTSTSSVDLSAQFLSSTGASQTYDVKPLSVCTPPAEFESTAPTWSSDRACTPVRSECDGSNEYETAAFTFTSDRVCSAQPTCTAHQIETTAGSSTTRRVCTAKCAATHYYAEGCKELKTCAADEVETQAPTATTDRQCGSADYMWKNMADCKSSSKGNEYRDNAERFEYYGGGPGWKLRNARYSPHSTTVQVVNGTTNKGSPDGIADQAKVQQLCKEFCQKDTCCILWNTKKYAYSMMFRDYFCNQYSGVPYGTESSRYDRMAIVGSD